MATGRLPSLVLELEHHQRGPLPEDGAEPLFEGLGVDLPDVVQEGLRSRLAKDHLEGVLGGRLVGLDFRFVRRESQTPRFMAAGFQAR